MRNLFYLLSLLCFMVSVETRAQITSEKLFFDTESKEGGKIDFQFKVADGVIIGGRFLDKDGFLTGIIKIDTTGTLKWKTFFKDSMGNDLTLISPVLDKNGNLYLIAQYYDSFFGRKTISCLGMRTTDGSKIWETKLPELLRYDNIKLKDFNDFTCSIFIFKEGAHIGLTNIQKNSGILTNINLPVRMPFSETPREDYGVLIDSRKNVYVYAGRNVFKLDANNGYNLLWTNSYSVSSLGKPYIDNADKLYIFAINEDVINRLNFYRINNLNGAILDSVVLRTSVEPVNIKESNDGIYFINDDRYVGGGYHTASILKFSKTTNTIVWHESYFINDRYSKIKSFDFDANGFIYVTGHNSTNETITGSWMLHKINPVNGSVLYKSAIRPDITMNHEASYGMGVYLYGNNAYMIGHLQTINSVPFKSLARNRLTFMSFNVQSGQVSRIKNFLGNYQFESKVEQIIPTSDRIIVVKQKGVKVDIESYAIDKRLIWTKSFGTSSQFLRNPVATVSPTGNIGLVARSYYRTNNDNLNEMRDSLVAFALDKNGRLLWNIALEDSELEENKEIFFSDVGQSLILRGTFAMSNSFIQFSRNNLPRVFIRSPFPFVPTNRLSVNTPLNFLQIYNPMISKWCSLNMTTRDQVNCTASPPLYMNLMQTSIPLSNNKMLFGGNSCIWGSSRNSIEFVLSNTQNGNFLWQSTVPDIATCASTVLKMAVDKSEQNAYALVKRADSVFLYKINFLTGRIVFNKPIFNEKLMLDVQDFIVSPLGDKLILTGTIVQNQHGSDYKNIFVRVLETTAGGLINYEIKKGELKGHNTVGKGIAFFPDDTYWIGGNIQKTNEGKAGVIYEAKLSNQVKSISGNVYLDSNNNGVVDALDIPLPNALITAKQSNTYAFTDSLGYYSIYLNSALRDTISVNIGINNATYKPKSYAISQTDFIKNFMITLPANTQDLRVVVTEITPPRRGFNNNYHIFYKNVGNITMSGKVRLSLNPIVVIQSALPNLPLSDAISTYWDYSNLKPNEERSITVYCKGSLNAVNGAKISTISTIEPLTSDVFKADNKDSLAQIVVGSYDPNDKKVSFINNRAAPSVIDASTELFYAVRFQNTGNYPADFVQIVDTLSDKLDISTLNIITASHPHTVSLNNKNILTFDFNPIYLPDSIRNERASHGFIKFSIKPKKALLKDEIIKNTAHIYFDYNPAIVTNTVQTMNQKINAVLTSSVSQDVLNLELSPNPTQDVVTFAIESNSFSEGNLSIYDLVGRLLLTKMVYSKTGTLNVKNFNEGEYICIIRSQENILYVNRFVKIE